ncbi:1034_t:CDS:2, partial [Cetraspora pellucida]
LIRDFYIQKHRENTSSSIEKIVTILTNQQEYGCTENLPVFLFIENHIKQLESSINTRRSLATLIQPVQN